MIIGVHEEKFRLELVEYAADRVLPEPDLDHNLMG